MLFYLYDSDGQWQESTDTEATSESVYQQSNEVCTRCYWNGTIEKCKGSIKYNVKKGTYYLRFKNTSNSLNGNGSGKLTFTATYPSATAKKAKISYININLAKGSTLSLGATVTNGGTVTWKSSNSSVVTVSSAGSITAKGKGSAIITAKCGSSSKKVKIVVS